MSGAHVPRVVVGGNGARGFFHYSSGTVPLEDAGAVSLAHAADLGDAEALARLCDLVIAEKPSRTREGATYFLFAWPPSSVTARRESDELTERSLTPRTVRALRVALGVPLCRGPAERCEPTRHRAEWLWPPLAARCGYSRWRSGAAGRLEQ